VLPESTFAVKMGKKRLSICVLFLFLFLSSFLHSLPIRIVTLEHFLPKTISVFFFLFPFTVDRSLADYPSALSFCSFHLPLLS